MAREGFANDLDGITTLTAAITAADAAIPVALGDVGPANAPFRIRIEEELVLVTSTGASPWTVLARGIEGSQPAAHPSGAPLAVVLTAVGLVTAIEDRLRAPLPGESLGTPSARFATVSTQALDLPVTPSTLLGRGATPGSVQEVSLGTGLAMAGATLNATPAAPPAVTPLHLLGRGTTPGVMEELTLGANLSMTGTTVNAAGGAPLPTAAVGQVLVSAGAGTAPIFDDDLLLSGAGDRFVTLIDNAQPADQRRWRIGLLSGGYLVFDLLKDDGSLKNRRMYFSAAPGSFAVFDTAVQIVGNFVGHGVALIDRPFGAVVGPTAGMLVNFSNSTTNTPGAVITGGGAFNVLGRFDGTNWKVVMG